VFSWGTTHPVALESIMKVPNQKVARWPKCFSSFSDGLALLCEPLTVVWNSTEQCTTLSLFHNFEVLPGTCNHALKNYGFQCGTPSFSFVCKHSRTLSNDMKLFLKITELEIQSVLCILCAWVWEPVYWTAALVWEQTSVVMWWQTSSQACTCC